jgi:hypothetical protein
MTFPILARDKVIKLFMVPDLTWKMTGEPIGEWRRV